MLVGQGALQFALEHGFKKQNLLTPSSKKSWEEWKINRKEMKPHDTHDTISVLAQDQKGLLSAAEKSYETALEQQPEFLDALNNLGNVLRLLERPEDAIKQFLRAIEINSNFMEAHHNLGNAYQDLSLFEKATDSYLIALSINPDFTESQKNLGSCLLGCGQYREGLNYLRKSCGVIEFTLGEYPQYQLAR